MLEANDEATCVEHDIAVHELMHTIEPDERRIISGAMRAIERNSCIRFRKRSNEADFVDIQNKPNEGCYTTVGRSPGRNIVMLEANDEATCVEHDIAVHELMHTIGLWHEQMRYDRDKYIKIHYENIDPIYYSQFEKISSAESTTYGVPYDYRSVMHYAKDAFAERPGLVTMETLDKKYQAVIGKVKDAAPSDYIKICSIYGCKQCLGKPFSGANQSDVVAGGSSPLARLQANDDSNQGTG
ncbi:CRE-NAS-5 protein [Aphelenchoides avenae]|nr:CRE-NAS-5 protein [Aphelenchus avenae]